jgi:hypothetical protein
MVITPRAATRMAEIQPMTAENWSQKHREASNFLLPHSNSLCFHHHLLTASMANLGNDV